MKIFLPMLKSIVKKWDVHKSPLYRHIKTKEVDKTFGPKLQQAILQSINNYEEMTYLKENTGLKELIEQVDME